MNNRIMAMLFALVAAMFISIVPVKAEAASVCNHKKTEWKSDAFEHRSVCKSCGEVVVKSVKHNDVVYIENGETHTMKCRTCGYTEEKAHTPKKDGDSCRCSLCEKLVEHTYELVQGSENHAMICKICGNTKDKAAHEWTVVDNGNGTHTKTCSVCEKVVANEACVDVTTDKDCACDVCGAVALNNCCNSRVEVTGKLATCEETGISGHLKCEFCGQLYSKSIAGKKLTEADITTKALGHKAYTSWMKTEDGKGHYHMCQNAGCEEKLEYAEHDLEWKHDGNYHWQKCKVCDYCTEGVKHTYTYTANEGKYTHNVECETCGKKIEESQCFDQDNNHKCDRCDATTKHGYNDGCMGKEIYKKVTCTENGIKTHKKCSICGLIMRLGGEVVTEADLVREAEGHEMEYVHNDDGHWQKCKNCDEKTDAVPHDASAYTYVEGAYQHVLNCATCGRGSSAYKLDCVDKNNDCACDLCGGMMWHVRDDMTYHSSVKATCTTNGRVGHFSCNTCGKLFEKNASGVFVPFTESTVREALGHDLGNVAVGVTAGGLHQMRCSRCDLYEARSHYSEDGDCICDVVGCNVPAHSHKLVFVAGKDATCTEAGTEAYYKYEGCGKMFDLYQNPISAAKTIPATGHDFEDVWTPAAGGVHVKACANCDEVQTEQHTFSNGNVQCTVCGGEEELTHVAAKAATCTENGNVEYWTSAVTGKKYADAAGNTLIADVTVKATGHEMSGWQDAANGVGHKQVCMNAGCNHTLTANHDNVNSCFCTECGGFKTGHAMEMKNAVAATCAQEGTQAYFQCSCGKIFDMGYNQIEAPVAIKKLNHNYDNAEVQKDAKSGQHYVACADCGNKVYQDHAMQMSDPMKGNYHQYLCACGELEIETHYDKNGDNKCDVCDHNMNGAQETTPVQQHDNKTVVTGQADKVQANNSWWQNWLEALIPGNSGGSNATETSTSTGSNTTASGNTASSGNTTTGTANTGNSSSTGSTASSGSTTTAPSTSGSTITAPSAEQTSVIAQFITWFLGLFGF